MNATAVLCKWVNIQTNRIFVLALSCIPLHNSIGMRIQDVTVSCVFMCTMDIISWIMNWNELWTYGGVKLTVIAYSLRFEWRRILGTIAIKPAILSYISYRWASIITSAK